MSSPPRDRPFAIVDGSIAAAGEREAVGHRLRSVPGLAAVLRLRAVQHVAAARRLAGLVRERPAFLVNELRGAPGLRAYTLCAGGRTVLLRHDGVDVWTFNELFLLGLYRPPQPVAARLAAVDQPLILDLGANIGMFGLDALVRYQGARILAWEPDPENAAIHAELIRRNGDGPGRWTLRQACAGTAAGTTAFLSGQATASRTVEAGSPGSTVVAVEDAMAAFADADLVKVDIEGAEWALLEDPRFAAAANVVLEYHPPGCPGADPHMEARRLLAGHGFTLVPLFEHHDGYGMTWAYRS